MQTTSVIAVADPSKPDINFYRDLGSHAEEFTPLNSTPSHTPVLHAFSDTLGLPVSGFDSDDSSRSNWIDQTAPGYLCNVTQQYDWLSESGPDIVGHLDNHIAAPWDVLGHSQLVVDHRFAPSSDTSSRSTAAYAGDASTTLESSPLSDYSTGSQAKLADSVGHSSDAVSTPARFIHRCPKCRRILNAGRTLTRHMKEVPGSGRRLLCPINWRYSC